MPANYQPRKEFPDQKIKLVSIYDTVVLGARPLAADQEIPQEGNAEGEGEQH